MAETILKETILEETVLEETVLEETIHIPESGKVNKKNSKICGFCKSDLRTVSEVNKSLSSENRCNSCKLKDLNVKTIVDNNLVFCRRQLICTCPTHTIHYIICDNCREEEIKKYFESK